MDGMRLPWLIAGLVVWVIGAILIICLLVQKFG